ncbi:hypothetical protein LTR05_003408 [Lithohypha guttulata]|uniref:Glutathione S-transferase n=1 Tax=Lithohypha guttulata TaxID=1690604 RepID=A0AAN7T711_9EURO|nr:hypothetical protein LTR05_003408 [Lithohypha guttulata]
MPSTNGHPDADLHPVATGPAIRLVEAHKEAAPHILYSGWFCPFVQRSWITLEEKQIPYQYNEINPYHKDPEFLKLNPRGLVPTLGCPVSGGQKGEDGVERKPLIESNIISEYLDSLPSERPALYASDLYTRAQQKVWIDFVGTRIIPAFHRLLQHTPEKQYSLEDAKLELRGHLRTWIAEASQEGPYWSGKEMSMVDVTLAPWAVRLWIYDHFKGIKDLVPAEGQGGDDEKIWKRWRQWSKAIEERESVSNTLSDREHYLPIYQRYAEDRAQSELAKATRQGRGVP